MRTVPAVTVVGVWEEEEEEDEARHLVIRTYPTINWLLVCAGPV